MDAVYAEFRTGKTQQAHTTSVVTRFLPESGGASRNVSLFNLSFSHSIAVVLVIFSPRSRIRSEHPNIVQTSQY